MATHARLQFEELLGGRREEMKQLLLRYCEPDSLPMGMALQLWMDMARA